MTDDVQDVIEKESVFSRYSDYVRYQLRRKLLDREQIAMPYFKLVDGIAGSRLVVNQRECINYCSSNYLNLAGHASVSQAAKEAIDVYGTSVSASRLVGGDRPILYQLERTLSTLLQVEDSLTFVSGYTANMSTISCLFGEGDLVVYDQLCHNSIIQGAKLSGAATRSFRHNDCEALDKLLTEHRAKYERVLIVIEGLYSMDGDLPPLPDLVNLKEKHDAILMVDEAHSIGVLGARGAGVREHFGIEASRIEIYMGALSKAFAGCGGYIAGDRVLIELLKYHAAGFVFSVGLSPVMAATSLKAMEIMQQEPQRVRQLRANSQLFLSLAKAAGLNTGLSEGIVVIPVLVSNDVAAVKLSDRLLAKGIYVQPMIYPAVKRSQARLRFFINAEHTAEEIKATVQMICDCL
ncbi:MAG: aminotransferase class I/II-fold pyridoxal phosphate-dependent enzyme [Gammaproteobacteria bacterium]|nr:aminotransferase class I/II-fold pyridoxal phosphate-dependent enzyme [Gammaproteobacteria bacterium]